MAYAVMDVKRARKFYEGVLGLKPGSVSEGKGYAFIEYWIGEHTLAIGQGAKHFRPGKTGATVALEVEDFDVALKELRKHKVKFLMEPYEGGICRMALVADPEGNQIMIHRRKTK